MTAFFSVPLQSHLRIACLIITLGFADTRITDVFWCYMLSLVALKLISGFQRRLVTLHWLRLLLWLASWTVVARLANTGDVSLEGLVGTCRWRL